MKCSITIALEAIVSRLSTSVQIQAVIYSRGGERHDEEESDDSNTSLVLSIIRQILAANLVLSFFFQLQLSNSLERDNINYY